MPARLRRGKVLGVAIRKRNVGLALRALGFHGIRGIPRVHLPQITTAKGYGLKSNRDFNR